MIATSVAECALASDPVVAYALLSATAGVADNAAHSSTGTASRRLAQALFTSGAWGHARPRAGARARFA